MSNLVFNPLASQKSTNEEITHTEPQDYSAITEFADFMVVVVVVGAIILILGAIAIITLIVSRMLKTKPTVRPDQSGMHPNLATDSAPKSLHTPVIHPQDPLKKDGNANNSP